MTFTPPQSNPVAVTVTVGSGSAVQALVVSAGGNGYLSNAGQVPVYYSASSGVTPSTGTQLLPNTTVPINSSGTYYAITAAGLSDVQGTTWPATASSGGSAGNLVDVVAEFGVDNTGTATDNGPKLNTAVNTLAQEGLGGFIPLPSSGAPAVVNVATPLVFGNGTNSTASTINGPVLVGAGFPYTPGGFGYAPTGVGPVQIKWTGGSSGSPTLLTIAGPLEGWYLAGLYLDGNGAAANGVTIVSGVGGGWEYITVVGCTAFGVQTTVATTAISNTQKNEYYRTHISVPAGATGLALGNSSSTSTNNCYDRWNDITMVSASGNPVTQTNGIYIANVDSLFMSRVNVGAYNGEWCALELDYGPSSGGWPSACIFEAWDFGTPGSVTGKGYLATGGSRTTGGQNHIILPGSANGRFRTLMNTYGFNLQAMGVDVFDPGDAFGTTTLATPAVPGSTTALSNYWPVAARVFINGTLTANTQINGVSTGVTNGPFLLMPNDTITLTYSSTPTWVWFGT